MAAGTTLEKTGDHQITFTFTTVRPEGVLYAMAYGTFCPGPSHILQPEHPAFSDNTYEGIPQRLPAGIPEHARHGRLGFPWNTPAPTTSS